MKRQMSIIIVTFIFCTITIVFQNCRNKSVDPTIPPSQGTTTGNPERPSDGGFTALPFNPGNVTEMKLCLVYIQYYLDGISSPQIVEDLQPKEVSLNDLGSTLSEGSFPIATIVGVDLILDNSCGTDHSLLIKNAHGEHKLDGQVSLAFKGNLTISFDEPKIGLDIQPFVTAFEGVSTDVDLFNATVLITGNLTNKR